MAHGWPEDNVDINDINNSMEDIEGRVNSASINVGFLAEDVNKLVDKVNELTGALVENKRVADNAANSMSKLNAETQKAVTLDTKATNAKARLASETRKAAEAEEEARHNKAQEKIDRRKADQTDRKLDQNDKELNLRIRQENRRDADRKEKSEVYKYYKTEGKDRQDLYKTLSDKSSKKAMSSDMAEAYRINERINAANLEAYNAIPNDRKHRKEKVAAFRKLTKDQKIQVGEETAASSKAGLLKFFKFAGVVAAVAKFAINVAKTAVNYGSKENLIYAGQGGPGNQKVLGVANSLARLKEAAAKAAMSLLGLEKDFKSFHEVYAEALAEKTGYTEATLGQMISDLDVYLRSTGLAGNKNNALVSDKNIASEISERLVTEYASAAKYAGIEDKDLGSAFSSFFNMVKSGSGYDSTFGFALSDNILEAAMRESPELSGKGFYSTISPEDKLTVRQFAAQKLLAIYTEAEKTLKGSGTQAVANQIEQWEELGQKINAAKNQLFAFDEVIAYTGQTTFGKTVEEGMTNISALFDEDGKIITVDVDLETKKNRNFVELFTEFMRAASTNGDMVELKARMTTLLEAQGVEYETAKEMVDAIYDDADLTQQEKHKIMWGIAFDHNQGNKWTYQELVDAIKGSKLNGSHTIEFKTEGTGLTDLASAVNYYSTLTGVSPGVINIGLSTGSQTAFQLIENAAKSLLTLSDEQLWNKIKNNWPQLRNAENSGLTPQQQHENDIWEANQAFKKAKAEFEEVEGKNYSTAKEQEAAFDAATKKVLEARTRLARLLDDDYDLYLTRKENMGKSGGMTPSEFYQKYSGGKYTGKTEDEIIKDYYNKDKGSISIAELNGEIPIAKVETINVVNGSAITFKPNGGLQTHATGGIATRATAGIFGEAGAEAILPLETSAGVDYLRNALQAAGAGSSTEVHVTLNGQILEMNDYNVNRLGQKLGAIIENANNRRGSQNYGTN